MAFFQNSVLNKYLKTQVDSEIEEAFVRYSAFFHNSEIQKNIYDSKEEQFQTGFLRELFVNILGYTLNPSVNYNLTTEYKNEIGAKKADGAIVINQKALAVIELKGTDTTDLDKINTQAFNYKNNHTNCIYVITSNFERLRFFINNSVEHLEFNLFQLSKNDFRLLWLCLHANNLLKGIPLKIKEESLIEDEDITNKLYKDYASFRTDLWLDMVKNNNGIDKLLLFKKTQKLLDRFLFILFAEDSGLLPPNLISTIVQRWYVLKEEDNYKSLYEIFKQHFGYINTGRSGKTQADDIFAYNGGLFLTDILLDEVIIEDEIIYRHVIKLSKYNFQSEVDVNILGHIFENSLSEIETITAQLQGQVIDKSKSKRKKDGVFYTPKFITKYIIDNTIGKLCTEKKVELNIVDEEFAKGRKNRKKDVIKKLQDQLKSYRSWLLEITICDPACGSGAFLNQALEFLMNEHIYIDKLQAQLFGLSIVFQDVSNHILENNLFGVDINEESVEIAKLSLWLRTAQRGRKLTTLNNNIQCGNSLIDVISVAKGKAFNWKNAFPDIFEKGGFDVIIGNPPYGDYFSTEEKEYVLKKYPQSFSGTFDIYNAFFELGLNITRSGGLLGYITPHTFIEYSQFNGVRDFLRKGNSINHLIKLVEVFEDAVVDNVILILSKNVEQVNFVKSKIFKSKITTIEQDMLNDLPKTILSKEGYQLQELRGIDLDKLCKDSICLGDYAKITQGITTGGNDFFIKDVSEFIKAGIPSASIKKTLRGENINRYELNFDNEFILYSIKSMPEQSHEKISIFLTQYKDRLSSKRETQQGKLPWYCLHWPRNSNDFEAPKILIRQTASKIIATLDFDKYYPIDSIHTINIKVESLNIINELKYLLGLLNSNLFKYLYNWKLDEVGKVFPQIKKFNIEWMPIKKYSEGETLSQKVSDIIDIYNDFKSHNSKFLRFVASSNSNLLLSERISEWYNLDFNDFINELKALIKKQGFQQLSKKEEIEWMEIFDEYHLESLSIKNKIENLEGQINQVVYDLYCLSSEEIAIIESK